MSADEVAAAQAEVDQTREELQETVDELAERLNPKNQAKAAGARASEFAQQRIEQLRHLLQGHEKVVAGAAGVLIVTVLFLRRTESHGDH